MLKKGYRYFCRFKFFHFFEKSVVGSMVIDNGLPHPKVGEVWRYYDYTIGDYWSCLVVEKPEYLTQTIQIKPAEVQALIRVDLLDLKRKEI